MNNKIRLNPYPGSFRDPSNQVYILKDRILRKIIEKDKKKYLDFYNSNFYKKIRNKVVHTEIDNEISNEYIVQNKNDLFFSHKKISFISYPFEWPFFLYKKAAIFHLELLIDCLENNYTLSDSSPYNIQFTKGLEPKFIDFGSFIPYELNSPWLGYKQFCEQFLSPLLIENYSKLNFQKLIKNNLEGIDLISTSKILPKKTFLNYKIFANIHFHSYLINKIDSKSDKKNKNLKIKKENIISLLKSLKDLINNLKSFKKSYWGSYKSEDSYSNEGQSEKENILANYVQNLKPNNIIDLGCNNGKFTEIALKNGANFVVGTDNDFGSLEKSCLLAQQKNLNFLPLYIDLTDPTPNIGFQNLERESFLKRSEIFDGLIAFALIHHLCLSKNIPLKKVILFILSLANSGIIEFVPIEDPQCNNLMFNKKIKHEDYNLENFELILKNNTKTFKKLELPNSLRVLYIYEI